MAQNRIAPYHPYSGPNQQGQQQQVNDNVSSSTSSFLPVSGQAGTTAIEIPSQPSGTNTSGTANNFTGNLNQSSFALTPSVTNTSPITTLGQKGTEAQGGLTTSQPSNPETISALQLNN